MTEIDLEAVSDSFARLSTASKTLNEARDSMNLFVRDLEKALQKLHLGISGWVECAVTTTTVRSVGYTKFNGHWGLHIRLDEKDKASSTWVMVEAPSWMRLEAVGKLPALLTHLESQAEESLRQFRKKTQQLHDFCEALQGTETACSEKSPFLYASKEKGI